MKRSTIILLLIALIAGVAVYYLEIKPGKPRDEEPDKTKAAFTIKREEITGLNLTRGGQTINFEVQNGKWMIKQPVNAIADESALNSLVGDLVGTQIQRELTASANEVKSYGLAEPAIKLEVKLKDGKTHRVEIGTKDVIGYSAYARIDGAQNVALIGSSLLTSSDKSLNDFRDRSILGATQYELGAAKFTNENGAFELVKQESEWAIKSPVEEPAEESEVNSLISEIASAKASEIVSETADDPAKYGLDKPKLTFTAQLTTGGERVVSLGSKIDDKYYARTSDRPQIYKVESSLFDKLNTKLSVLRSRTILKFERDQLARVQIRNPNLTLVAEKNGEGKWLVKQPADKKDKEASTFKLFDPLETKASELIDKPSAAIAARLAKPAVEIRLTDKEGKTTTIKVSSADGENVYVRVDARPTVYKVAKSMLESLSFKIEDAIEK